MTDARIAPLDPPYPEAVAAALQKIMPPGVDPLVLFRTLAVNERVSFRRMAGGLLDRGSIGLREREIAIDRSCARCGGRGRVGRAHGVIRRARGVHARAARGNVRARSRRQRLPPREQLLLRLADEFHDTSRVSDPLWAALRAEWTDVQLIELDALAGFYPLISFCANALRLPREPYAARFPEREQETRR